MNTYEVIYLNGLHIVHVTTPAGVTFKTPHGYADRTLADTYIDRCISEDTKRERRAKLGL